MVYRDDELGKLRSRMDSAEKRLQKFEALYKEHGLPKKIGRKLFDAVFGSLKSILSFLIGLIKNPFVVGPILVIGGLVTFICTMNYKSEQWTQEAVQEVLDKCSSFCETHGHSFHDKREGDLCFCTNGNSETTSFIINMETSEHWSVSE